MNVTDPTGQLIYTNLGKTHCIFNRGQFATSRILVFTNLSNFGFNGDVLSMRQFNNFFRFLVILSDGKLMSIEHY